MSMLLELFLWFLRHYVHSLYSSFPFLVLIFYSLFLSHSILIFVFIRCIRGRITRRIPKRIRFLPPSTNRSKRQGFSMFNCEHHCTTLFLPSSLLYFAANMAPSTTLTTVTMAMPMCIPPSTKQQYYRALTDQKATSLYIFLLRT